MRITGILLICVIALSPALTGQASPRSKSLIREADELFEIGKLDQAMTKYEAAEKADPAWDGFAWLEKFATDQHNFDYASPELRDETARRALDLRVAHAFARSARRHPDRADVFKAMQMLSVAGEHDDAFALGSEILKASPRNPHAVRGEVMAVLSPAAHQARAEEAEKRMPSAMDRALEVFTLPEDLHFLGVVCHNFVSKANATPKIKQAAILRGTVALDRALKASPDNFEVVVYRSLLLREEAKLASDPREAERLTAEADRYRANAAELLKRRQENN